MVLCNSLFSLLINSIESSYFQLVDCLSQRYLELENTGLDGTFLILLYCPAILLVDLILMDCFSRNISEVSMGSELYISK